MEAVDEDGGFGDEFVAPGEGDEGVVVEDLHVLADDGDSVVVDGEEVVG